MMKKWVQKIEDEEISKPYNDRLIEQIRSSGSGNQGNLKVRVKKDNHYTLLKFLNFLLSSKE